MLKNTICTKWMQSKINNHGGVSTKNLNFNLVAIAKKNNKYNINMYKLETYKRSNQDTCLVQKPVVIEGDWVQSGELLADCASSVGGELSLGQNLLIAYMPWEGYNFEDAILISERLVIDDLYTSVHIERYEIEPQETKLGKEQITRNLPDVILKDLDKIDSFGVIKLGSWVEEGDILVGKITPINKKAISPYQKLLYTILEKQILPYRESSLRAPKGIKAKVIDIKYFPYKSIEKKEKSLNKKKKKKRLHLFSKTSGYKNMKLKNLNVKNFYFKNLTTTVSFALLRKFYIIKNNKQCSEPIIISRFSGSPWVITHKNYNTKKKTIKNNKKNLNINIHIYLAEKRKIQVGDKMAGRHGNKGIVSKILPFQDMPFLPDGTPIDMVLNPLGVPSRMNVGQIYECLLGLAGKYLGENYKIFAFDELYGPEASRNFVYNKLYEARCKTGSKWLFNPSTPGKIRIFDGRNGDCFDQNITVGYAYILRLVHMVDDKIHMRSTGPYSLVTQQPLRGRSKQGGQRLGEMEVWAIEGFGAAFTLLEMLTIKSDDMIGRMTLWSNLILNKQITIGTPESFKVLICELQALCLDIGLFK